MSRKLAIGCEIPSKSMGDPNVTIRAFDTASMFMAAFVRNLPRRPEVLQAASLSAEQVKADILFCRQSAKFPIRQLAM